MSVQIDNDTLRTRVKGQVHFAFFSDGALWYACDDGWQFPVPISDAENAQGGSPTFNRDDKGIFFMRWIRRFMEGEVKLRDEALNPTYIGA